MVTKLQLPTLNLVIAIHIHVYVQCTCIYVPLIHIHGSEVMDHTHSLTSLQTTVQSKHVTHMGRGSWKNAIMQVHVSTMAVLHTILHVNHLHVQVFTSLPIMHKFKNILGRHEPHPYFLEYTRMQVIVKVYVPLFSILIMACLFPSIP